MTKLHTNEIVGMGNPQYRKEDPVHPEIMGTLDQLRSQIGDYLLDATTPFYDKLFALDATQNANHREFASNKVVSRLHEAVGGLVLMRVVEPGPYVDPRTKLLLGHLDKDRPWSFANVSKESGPLSIDLVANFTVARTISGTYRSERSSYGQTSYSTEVGPSVTNPLKDDETAIHVGLTHGYIGVEKLYDRMADFAASLHLGSVAIHAEIDNIQAGKTDYEKQVLHAAATDAAVQLVVSSSIRG